MTAGFHATETTEEMVAGGHPFVEANHVGDRRKAWLPLAVWLCFTAASTFAEARVALVSTCGGAAGQNVLALAEAALRAHPLVADVIGRCVKGFAMNSCLM